MRVALVLMGKEAGISLRELAVLLAVANPMDRADLLRRHVAELDQRIAQAQAAKDLIEQALCFPLPSKNTRHSR